MELDEKSQYCLMLFIKKTLGQENDDFMQDSELNKKEIEILRNEKIRLSEEIVKIQEEFIKNKEIKEKVMKENEELRLSIIDLQSELSKSPTKHESDKTEIYHKLEKKLAEKSHMLEQTQETMREAKTQYEKSIAQLKDELDIAQNKICQNNQAEKALESYKKKVEKMTAMKKRLIDLKRNNEHMQQLIIEHQSEIETYQQFKKTSIFYKEEHLKEKEKNENLTLAIDLREKQISKLNKLVAEMSDKILYQENRIHELEIPLDSSFASEDSYNYNKIDNEPDFRRNSRFIQGALNPGSEMVNKELSNLKSVLLKKKSQITMFKEIIQMQHEELITKNRVHQEIIAQLSSRNEAMAHKLEILSENISNSENEKENFKQISYELKNLKNYKDSLLSEIKNLYEEKDIIYKKYISGREEIIMYNNKLHEKEFIIRDLQLNLKVFIEKIKNFEESDKKEVKSDDLRGQFELLRRQNKDLSLENYGLRLSLQEKNQRIEDILKEKEENIKTLKSEHYESIEKLKHESEWKSEQICRQTEEALSQIQKEKDEIQARLSIEKKSNLMEWKKAMILKDPSMLFSEEANKMKLQIAELEKENEKLLRTNQELTICWKDSARMLKSVSKSVGIETKRMQKIMKQKH